MEKMRTALIAVIAAIAISFALPQIAFAQEELDAGVSPDPETTVEITPEPAAEATPSQSDTFSGSPAEAADPSPTDPVEQPVPDIPADNDTPVADIPEETPSNEPVVEQGAEGEAAQSETDPAPAQDPDPVQGDPAQEPSPAAEEEAAFAPLTEGTNAEPDSATPEEQAEPNDEPGQQPEVAADAQEPEIIVAPAADSPASAAPAADASTTAASVGSNPSTSVAATAATATAPQKAKPRTPKATTAKKKAAPPVTAKPKNTPAPPSANIYYRTHVQNDGWQWYRWNGETSGTSGRGLRLEAIKIYLIDDNGDVISGSKGGVQYQVHVQNIGWQAVKANNTVAGTSGKAYRLEAIRIKLTGDVSRYYDVFYRTHVQNIGWQNWVKNGAVAGTSGKGYRLEAIEIKLKEKEAKQAATDGIVGVRYRGHVQNIGWQPQVQNGTTAGTSGRSLRVEALNIYLDKGTYSGGIEYRGHVQNIGWQGWKADGATAGTTGRSLRVEALQIRLTGDIAKAYDVVYRAHVQNVGWQNWCVNGTTAGTSGKSLRVEALQIKLVKKDSKQTVSEGTYFIASAANPNVSAEDPNASTKSGTQARGYTTNYTNAQRYYIRNEGSDTYSIQSVASGLFLADKGGKVLQVADSTSQANRWKLVWNGGYSLVNASTGKEIGFSDGSVKSGTTLATKAPTQKAAQRWTLTPTNLISDGTYRIACVKSGYVLDVNGASWENGANVMVHKANGGGNQAFVVKSTSGDTYRITCAMTGKAVEVRGGSTANGANVQQYASNGTKAQRWDATLDRNGKIVFTNMASGKVLTAASGANGANVTSSNNAGASTQEWTLQPTTYKADPVLQRAMKKVSGSSSSTSNFITVDLTNHRVIVFQGRKGNWTPIKNWTVSTGAPGTPTVVGDYAIGVKGYSFGSGYTCYYYSQFYGDYLFHSVLYQQGTRNILDGRLGYSISHGCVRMNIDNAKWIYDHVPSGTHVKTYY